MAKVLVHRYDNEPDILKIASNGCSEVYQRSLNDDFEFVIVVPTLKARTNKAVIAQATSKQYKPDFSKSWPGRPDRYLWRVDLSNIRFTTVDIIKKAFDEAGIRWSGQWTVKNVVLPDYLIEDDRKPYPTESDIGPPSLVEEGEEPSATEGLLTEVTYYRRSRDRALRDRAFKESKGVCSVCDTDYTQLLDGKGVHVLQVHHRQQLAITDAPVITRLSDLAVVCANCHMLIHMDPKQALSVEALRTMMNKPTPN